MARANAGNANRWGAACKASEEALFDEFRKKREVGEGLPLGNIHLDIFMAVAGSPQIENFRDDDFPRVHNELSEVFENANEFPF